MNQEPEEKSAFDQIMAGSATVQARFEAGAETIISHAAALGAELTQEDIANMPALRIYALGGESLTDNVQFERELSRLPAIAAAKQRAAMLEQVMDIESEAHAKVMGMAGAQRMQWARANGAMGNEGEPIPVRVDSEAERLKILLEMPPSARLSLARKWDMCG